MVTRLLRATIVPVWFIGFGLMALLWSPLTALSGILLLVVGVAAPAVVLLLVTFVFERHAFFGVRRPGRPR